MSKVLFNNKFLPLLMALGLFLGGCGGSSEPAAGAGTQPGTGAGQTPALPPAPPSAPDLPTGSPSDAPTLDRVIGSTDGCSTEDFSSAAMSEYVLPYEVGRSYMLEQGNCGFYTHRLDATSSLDIRYAYDFAMPIGTIVTAARAGTVISLADNFPNGTLDWKKVNYVAVEHDDGTVAHYLHNQANTVMVTVGQPVAQGDPLALSGESGNTGGFPHLHFGVVTFEGWGCKINVSWKRCQSIPVAFSNANPLDTPPEEGMRYIATPH